MSQRNLIAIDLAKNSFHVAVRCNGQVTVDKAMTRSQLHKFLARQPPAQIAMEACGSAHYWCWEAESHGHETVLLPPFYVTPYRQGHKTDQTDALAILAAMDRPKRKEAVKKTPDQLALSTFLSIRQTYIDDRLRFSNAIRGHLLEFGITIPKSFSKLRQSMYEVLEDAENRLPHWIRGLIERLYLSFVQACEQLEALDLELKEIVKEHEPCQRLCQIEGIGPVNAVKVYARIGNGAAFDNGRQVSALFGVTPQQYSTGGVPRMGRVRQHRVDKRIRSSLLQGATSVVYKRAAAKTPPTTEKMKWLEGVIQRRGPRAAAMALVNKNLRTAWAMLRRDEAYVAA